MRNAVFGRSVVAAASRLAVTLALVGLSGPAARAQELRFVYCYVPVPATQTIYASTTLTVGPIAERASYGPAFAAHLAEQGLVPRDSEALCLMRSSEAQIAQSRQGLSSFCPINVDGTRSSSCGDRWTVTDFAWSGTGAARPVGNAVGVAGTVAAETQPPPSTASLGGQRQPEKPAYITYQPGSRYADGWEGASITVNTAIMNCGGTLAVALQLIPSSFMTGMGYWYRGKRYTVSPLVPKTPPAAVLYSSYLFAWSDLPPSVPGPRGAFGHFQVSVPSSPAIGCTGVRTNAGPLASLLHPAPTDRNIELFMNHLTIHPAALQPPPFRDPIVEQWIQREIERAGGPQPT